MIDEHVLERCRYTLAGEFDQYLFRSNCGPTVIRAFHDGALRSELTVPAAGGLDCASVECWVRSPIATPGRLTFVQASHVSYEILSVERWPYLGWRKSYVDSPELLPVLVETRIVVQVLGADGTYWVAISAFSGQVETTLNEADAGPHHVVAMCESGELVGLAG